MRQRMKPTITIKRVALLLLVLSAWSLFALPTRARQSGNDADETYDSSVLNIAPVAQTNPRPITSLDLLNIRDVRGVSISPDGKGVVFALAQAVLETNRYRTSLFVVGTTPGSMPFQLGSPGPGRWDDIGTFRPYALSWSPDSRYIISLMKGNDGWQLWRWKREGGKPEQLTHTSQDIEDYEWSTDGKRIFFTTGERVDLANAKVLNEGFLYDGSIRLWGRHTFPRLLLESKPRNTETWVLEFDSKIQRKATKEEAASLSQTPPKMEPGYSARGAKRSPDETKLAFIVRDSEGKESIWANSTAGGKPSQLSPAMSDHINQLWWRNDSKQIYFTQLLDDKSSLYQVAASGGKVEEINKGTDFLFSFSLSQDQTLAACMRYNATLPPVIAVLNLTTGAVQTLVDVNPEFKNLRLSPATKLEWKNKYGDRTYGYLVKPLNYEPGKRYPLIVTTYAAGAFLRGAAGDEYPIQVFAANGFAVLDFSAPIRKTVKDGDFKKALLRWSSPMESLAEAIKLLDEKGIIDPRWTGLSGLSFGAEITEFSISHSALFQAAITSGPAGRDPFFYDLAENGFRKLLGERWGLGKRADATSAERWRELAPALNAERIKAPLLVNSADSEVLASLMLWNSLKELDKPVELFIYPDESHIKSKPKHRYEIYERNVDWFNFWLQNKENPDPTRQKQYERWRAMRDGVRKEESQRTLVSN